MWDLPVDFYIVVLIPEVPHPRNEEWNLFNSLHVLTIMNNQVIPINRD